MDPYPNDYKPAGPQFQILIVSIFQIHPFLNKVKYSFRNAKVIQVSTSLTQAFAARLGLFSEICPYMQV